MTGAPTRSGARIPRTSLAERTSRREHHLGQLMIGHIVVTPELADEFVVTHHTMALFDQVADALQHFARNIDLSSLPHQQGAFAIQTEVVPTVLHAALSESSLRRGKRSIAGWVGDAPYLSRSPSGRRR